MKQAVKPVIALLLLASVVSACAPKTAPSAEGNGSAHAGHTQQGHPTPQGDIQEKKQLPRTRCRVFWTNNPRMCASSMKPPAKRPIS